jgi:hypothetical protein
MSANSISPVFRYRHYTLRKRVLSLLGAKIDVFDEQRNVVMHCQQKAFRLREDIRLYSDERRTLELLSINARSILDFAAAYDVVDRTSGEFVGTLRRRGWASMVRDSWEILDAQQQLVGRVVEDNMALALIRRLLTNLIPQRYDIQDAAGTLVAEADQDFNPFVYWLKLDIHQPGVIDPRLLLAVSMLLACIEGHQE